MKKVISLLLILTIVLSFCACGNTSGAGGQQGGLQVGFGRESIMPEGNVYLSGGDYLNRLSTGYMDILYTTCVALTLESKTILVYTLDLVGAGVSFTVPAKEAVSAATGIPVEDILMGATHTHAAPAIAYPWDGVEAYRKLFNEACVKAATDALADRSAAEAYAGGVQTEGLTFVRHYELSDGTYAGPNFGDFASGSIVGHACEADTEVQMIKFARAAEDKKDVVLMNFGAHATYNGASSDKILSADFPSPTREYIEKNSDSLVAYFIAGAGNQVPTSKISGETYAPTDYKQHGQKLGEYVVNALPTLEKTETTELELVRENYTATTNKEKLDKIADARKVVDVGREYGKTSLEVKAAASQYGFSSYYEASAVVEREKAPETADIPLSAISFGDLSMMFLPYELSGVHAMAMKEKSPFATTFIVALGDGSLGYIPTSESFEYGAYEAHVSDYARGTGELLIDEAVRILGTLKAE